MTITQVSARAVAVGAALALIGGLSTATADDPRGSGNDDAVRATTTAGGIVEHDLAAAAGARTGDDLRRSVDAYWTPERMAAAEPAVRRLDPAERRRLSRMPASERIAPGVGSRPVAGTPEASRTAERRSYTRRVGKMFYKFGKQNWVCSGAVVNTKRKNMVFTAAHCLWDKKKGWANKIKFVPGYKKGKEPFGSFYAKRIAIGAHFQNFHGQREDMRHDYGVMLVKNMKRGGPNIVKKVGAYGLQWGAKKRRKMKATGYPSFHTAGGVQKSCKGRTRLSRKYSWRGAEVLTMKCRAVTAGSSGGPWLHRGYVNGQNAGVNSFKRPRRIFTPWFGKGVKRLYKAYN